MAKKPKEGSNEAYNTTADELRQFVEVIENLQGDAKAIADDIKEKFAEAKGRGFDTKALRAILAERKKNADDLQEFEANKEMYRIALGMAGYALPSSDDETGEEDGMV